MVVYMIRTLLIAAILLVMVRPTSLLAQVGQLDDRTEFVMITDKSADGVREFLQAIVVWRGEPGWNAPRSRVERARLDSIFRWENLRASESGRWFVGSAAAHILVDRDGRSIIVEGQRFERSRRDSALVIMVTVPAGGQPRILSTAVIAAELPNEFWPKQWQSGDTTFSVRVPYDRFRSMLLDALQRSPAVAAFLR